MALSEDFNNTPTPEEISNLLKKIGGTQNELCATLLISPEKLGREDIKNLYLSLSELIRFRGLKLRYMDTVGLHQIRITHMLIKCSGMIDFVFKSKFDFSLGKDLAYHHDDTEAFSIFGDIPGPLKDTLTKRELYIIEYVDLLVIQKLTTIMCISSGRDYSEVLIESGKKSKLETKVLSYLDKVDGFMQTFHEIISGNKDFIQPFRNYMNTFRNFRDGKYPELLELFELARDPRELKEHFEDLHEEYEDVIEFYFDAVNFFDIDSLISQGERLELLLQNGNLHISEDILTKDYGLKTYLSRKKLFLACGTVMSIQGYERTPMEYLTMADL